jgi:serine/threonine protein kinase
METPLCPQCRTPMPARALEGLCPACLLEQGALDTQFNSANTAFVPPTIAELAPLFPSLEILEFIGRGGMGAVYKARQTALDRTVALKILPSDIAMDPAFSERFSREARALAKLNHPGIVTLYEFGSAGDLYFFLMEFVDGVTLRQLLLGERLSAREALTIVPRICDALQYAHDRGIVHRDIKPENILLDRQGNVKIADFGLAKLVGPEPEFTSSSAGTSDFTEIGKLMGTPAYMAPEQIEHPSSVDHRADIYALGVVFYQMLTGELPDKPLAPPSSRTLIDVRLDEIVVRALQRNPTLRFQQASDLKTMVEEISNTPSKTPIAKRKIPVLQACGVLLILCLPLSLAIPMFIYSKQPRSHFRETIFTTPGQKSRKATEEILKQAVGPFPGVALAAHAHRNEWQISVRDVDQDRANKRLDEARISITNALNRTNNDPLTETIRYSEHGFTSASVASWSSDGNYISFLGKSLWLGIALSTGGLLCVSLPRDAHSPPVSKIPGIVSLGFFICGIWGVYLTTRSFNHLASLPAIGIAVLTGVPAMVFGLSVGSGRMGRFIAALSWFALLGLCVNKYLPKPNFLDYGWKQIDVPATDSMSAPPVPAEPGNKDRNAQQSAVRAWLETVDAGKYAEAWNLVSTLTRTLESESEWTTKLRAVREPLGQPTRREWIQTKSTGNLEGLPKGIYLIYTFNTNFAGKSGLKETLTLILQDDGRHRIIGYSIQ